MVVVGRFIISFGPDLNGGWSLLTGDCYSEKDLVLNLLGTYLEWSLLTGGCYLEFVVSAQRPPMEPKFVANVDRWSLIKGSSVIKIENGTL